MLVALLFLLLLAAPAAAQEGHGGPVRALAIAPNGQYLVSGSLDQTAIVWDLPKGKVRSVRYHGAAVNAVATLTNGAVAVGGADGRIAIWPRDATVPARLLEGHTGPISALATDGARLASAAWDGTARIWEPDGGVRVLEGHAGNVNAVAFVNDIPVTAGADFTVRLWPSGGPSRVIRLPAPQNALAAVGGVLAAGGADGVVRFLTTMGEPVGELAVDTTPLTSLAVSADGSRLCVASIGGVVFVVDATSRRIVTVLHGAEPPVWSVVLNRDGTEVFSAGRALRRWDAQTGRMLSLLGPAPPPQPEATDRGARVFRACAVCHTLATDGGNRAGPTLHGLFGRRIGSVPGYHYSDALEHMNQVWTPETVAKLFEIGPSAFAPGTRMPEQIIADSTDRAALVDFLERSTR